MPLDASDDTAIEDKIQVHYDNVSPYYRLFWGDHVHHGFWVRGDESQAQAQCQLVEKLAQTAGVARGSKVLDVGCGLGGSSRWLARHLDCEVVGITVSPYQVEMAAELSGRQQLDGHTCFKLHDANRLGFPDASFDAIWVIECSEHLRDKEMFIAQCARLLRPGGVLALCAWVAPNDAVTQEQARLLQHICEAMLCPGLARRIDYTDWMTQNGLTVFHSTDITRQVERTWQLCTAIAKLPATQFVLRSLDEQTRLFVEAFPAMLEAYRTGAMGYAMCCAKKEAVNHAR